MFIQTYVNKVFALISLVGSSSLANLLLAEIAIPSNRISVCKYLNSLQVSAVVLYHSNYDLIKTVPVSNKCLITLHCMFRSNDTRCLYFFV